MSTLDCDVLVVGAGPAGCCTARSASKNGLKTIFIDKKEEIGMPVQCAEGVGSYLFPFMPFKIPKEQLIWKIDGMYFWADDLAIKEKGDKWSGYSINRANWDKWLASLAIAEGAVLYKDTKLLSFDFKENFTVKKVVAENKGKKISFLPKYVIGADGVNSTVLDCLGIKKKKGSIGYVKSYEMTYMNLKYPKYDQLFFGEFAPRAYAYIFPLSKNNANIGVGTLNENENLDELYDKFIDLPCVKKQLNNSKIVVEKSGDAPIRDFSDKLVYGNIFLVGDSANQNIKPFIEGNIPGIICGNLLGELIFSIFKGKENPETYEEIIKTRFSLIQDSQNYADFVYGENKIENKIFNLILLCLMSDIISPEENEIEKYLKKGHAYLKEYILKNGGFIEK